MKITRLDLKPNWLDRRSSWSGLKLDSNVFYRIIEKHTNYNSCNEFTQMKPWIIFLAIFSL